MSALAAIALTVGLLAGCDSGAAKRTTVQPAKRPATAVTTIWAVGDGADQRPYDDRVAALVARSKPSRFLYLGDVYPLGTASDYANYYEPGYGRLRAKTRPTPGNHEWGNRETGYDQYWEGKYGAPYYYSFNVGGWHLISLNSEGDTSEGSAQVEWLRKDLAKHPGDCTIAYFHKPRYSAGPHGDNAAIEPAWQALSGKARIVLSGHDHAYERLKPIDGITQFVVGTGGKQLYPINFLDRRVAHSSVTTFGALRLKLSRGRARYAYVATSGKTLDSGSIGCRA